MTHRATGATASNGSLRIGLLAVVTTLVSACSETGLSEFAKPPVAEPPTEVTDQVGEAPDWNDCRQGWVGEYSNLSIDHPDMNPPDGEVIDLATVDWWDQPAFQGFDPNLDFGPNWWPVDEGLDGDPAYFSVRWFAWLRAWSDTDVRFTVGSADDVQIRLREDVVFEHAGVRDFDPSTETVRVEAGQYPIEVRYAHRAGDSGFRFRVVGGDVSLCYAAYDDDGE